MTSSRRLLRLPGRGGLVGAPVPDECPQDVDTAAGEGQDGLGVLLALGALAVVEPARFVAGGDAEQRRVVEDPVEAAVVAPGAVQVAADPPGVPGRGRQ